MATFETGYSLEQHREGDSRHLDAPVLRLDLNQELAELHRGESWKSGGHSAKTLAKYPDLRLILIALKAGAGLAAHQTLGRISIQTLEGRVTVKIAEQRVELPRGALLALDPSVMHDVQASEESAILLTVSWPSGNGAQR